MTIRNSLLALLAEEPRHGYGLKSAFERSTARAWSLNVGQVYTTLHRLERDGLVEAAAPDQGGESERSKQIWWITRAGRRALVDWYREPVADDPPSRDELTLKVLLAAATGSPGPRAAQLRESDVGRVLRRQRVATMERLQEYTRSKRDADPDRELPWCLLLDSLILKAEAEMTWLDRCEAALERRQS